MSTEIDVAKYIAELEKDGMQNPLGAINSCVLRLANDIRLALLIKEKALVVNGHTPLLEVNLDMNACSAEIFMWSIAILASAWTEWIFAAKSNNPDYKNNPEKNKAANNAMICYPYVRKSVMDSMSKAKEIGIKPPNFRPEGVSAKFNLEKSMS